MSYTANYTGKSIAILIGVLYLSISSFSYVLAQAPQACPLGVYAEPVVEESESSFDTYAQSGMTTMAMWEDMPNGIFSDDIALWVDLEAGQSSQVLTLDNFRFNIPEGSQINGIQVVLEGGATAADAINELVVSLKTDDMTTLNLANYATYGQEWQTEESTWIYGTDYYLWSTDWTLDMINDPSFGLKLQLENTSSESTIGSIDRASIKVFYTPLYTICDHDCVVFFVDEVEEATEYNWIIPHGFQRLSGTYNPNVINIGKTTAQSGIYEICVETISESGTSEPCCREFRVDDCRPSSLGDFIFVDQDGDGIQDPEDLGLRNIVVSLFNENNEIVASTITNADGHYQFDNLQKGYYYLRLSFLPAGFVPTQYNTTNGSMDSDLMLFGSDLGTRLFYLDPGVFRDDFDFGVLEYSSINGLVWEDLNYNGIRSTDESLLSMITVDLVDGTGSIVATTTTDSNGEYSFDELLPGDYAVQIDLGDYLVTLANVGQAFLDSDFMNDGSSELFTLTSGTDIYELDAGLYQTASIGNYTWIDLDRDGIQDVTDLGLGKTWIKLYNSSGELVAEMDADDNGFYQFDGLLPGDYYLIVNIYHSDFQVTDLNIGDPSLDSDAIVDVDGNFGSVPFTLTSGEVNLDLDLGFQYIPSSISGFAWIDNNADGVFDNNELPKTDAIVSLLDAAGNTVASTSVRPDGTYSFDTLNPGDYQVSFTQVGDFLFSPQDIGDDDTDSDVNSTGLTMVISLDADQDIENVSAGYYQLASIGDYVFLDTNRNGIQDAVDTPLQGVLLELYNNNDELIATSFTDVNGAYAFSDLLPATYYVSSNASSDYQPTKSNIGTDDKSDSDLLVINGVYRTDLLTLTSGLLVDNLDLGYEYIPSSISGFVWEDYNANGILDTEDRTRPQFQVNLYNANGVQVASTTTDINGSYIFNTLDPIGYYVQFGMSVDDIATIANATAMENMDSDLTAANGPNTTDLITLGVGQDLIDVTAGFFRYAEVGDYVFLDENYNGIQNSTESGLAGITVSLIDINNNIIAQSITGSDGLYLFQDLRPSDYRIELLFPLGLDATLINQGNDVSLDSDLTVNGVLGSSPSFSLISRETNVDLDFGFISLSSISGLVWEDMDYSGTRENSEPLLSGFIVSLWDGNNQLITNTTTNANGMYSFGNLIPGDYQVRIERQDYLVTLPNVGLTAIDNDFDLDGSSAIFTIASGSDMLNIDAGFYRTASVGDYIFYDLNRDGIQNSGDQAFPKVWTKLFDADGTMVANGDADENGFYLFEGLKPGQYYIQVDADRSEVLATTLNVGDATIDSDATMLADGTFGSIPFTLTSGQVDLSIDLGFQYVPSSISGFTWIDDNGNGARDNSEQTAPGVTVSLLNSMGNIQASTIVDTEGVFTFSTLNPGQYTISFSDSEGMIFTSQNTASENIDSDVNASGFTDIINLAPAQDIVNIGAGYLGLSSIGDYVFLDLNRNGIQDAGDTGIEGVYLELYNSIGLLTAATTTDSDGGYRFVDLMPGNYFIRSNATANFIPTLQNMGTNDDIDSDLFIGADGSYRGSDILITSGLTITNQDLGYQYLPSSIGGFTWIDNNGDGVRDDDELPASGVTVSLINNMGATQAATIVSGDGSFIFETLNPGDYSISFSAMDAMIFTLQNIGDDTTDSDANAAGFTDVISIGAGQDINNIGAGFLGLSSIGDYVFLDLNRNGIQDAEDTGIADVLIQLYDGTGQVTASTTTDTNGAYNFNGLMPGNYYIVSNASADFIPTLQNAGTNDTIDSDLFISADGSYRGSDILITSGLSITNQDLGYQYIPSSISGFVFEDLNANGILNNNEITVSEIPVRLYDASGTLIATMDSDFQGQFYFDDLDPIGYYLEFGFTDAQVATIANATSDMRDSDITGAFGPFTTDLITLGVGEVFTAATAGYYIHAMVGDFVWNDLNLNGVQDTNEPGLSGVTINLYTENGSLVNSTMTGMSGMYRFMSLVPNSYYVEVEYPIGFDATLGFASSDNTIDSDITITNGVGRTDLFTLISGLNNLTIDLGLVDMRASITGIAFLDNNGNGLRDFDETLLSDIAFSLYDDNDVVIATTMTDINGMYSFAALLPNNYYVAATIPSDFFITVPNVGINDDIDSDFDDLVGVIRTPMLVLNPLTNMVSVDLGIYELINIGDMVWLDANKNGIFDNSEMGVEGFTIQLINGSGSVVGTTSTDAAGKYAFDNYPPGSYQIRAMLTPQYEFSAADQGMDDSIDSDITTMAGDMGFSAQILIPSGMDNQDLDIGLLAQDGGAISGTVWLDRDQDGALIADTEFIAGVIVNLFTASGDFISTTLTDDNGNYTLSNLLGGQYYVEFIDLSGAGFTTANAAADDIDSDVDNSNGLGTTSTFTLPINGTVIDIDAGVLPLDEGMIMGMVWNDFNQNGIRDNGELPVSGVLIQLFNMSGTAIVSMQSNSTGVYMFNGLIAGDYYIQVNTPTGFSYTLANVGMDDTIDSDITGANGAGTSDILSFAQNQMLDHLDIGLLDQMNGTIEGLVWSDLNYDGIRDMDEPLIFEATVILHNTAGQQLASTMTNINGKYTFGDLAVGDYYVSIVLASDQGLAAADQGMDDTVDSDFATANGPNTSPTISVGINETVSNIDAGIINLNASTISGLVWNDIDRNGIRASTEMLNSNVLVRLLSNTGVEIATTTTGANGTYIFGDLAAGSYVVSFATPLNFGFTGSNQGADDMLDSDVTEENGPGSTPLITLGLNQNIMNVDAGLVTLANSSISGLAWNDIDRDGVRATTEPLYADVVVRLLDDMGTELASTMSDVNGMYSFSNLFAGVYIIDFTAPSNFGFTGSNQGADDMLDSDVTEENGPGSTPLITLGLNQNIMNVDAGLVTLANSGISGLAWNDLDQNGIRSSDEPLFEGIMVRLLDNLGIEIGVMNTDADGTYHFDDLPAADYIIMFTTPPNFAFTTGNMGSDDTVDSDVTNDNGIGATTIFSLAVDEHKMNVDAGIISLANSSISGLVWQDTSRDGNRENNEPLIANVTVNVYNAGSLLATTTTNIDGAYMFNNLNAGLFNVEFIDPFGNGFTLANVGADDTVDSDVNDLVNGIATNVFLFLNDAAMNVDAGLEPPSTGSIAGQVWEDINRDGLNDNNETGYSGLTVNLYDSSDMLIATAITAADGTYSFDMLFGGDYYIEVIPAMDYQFSMADVGMDDNIDSDITDSNGQNTTDIITITGTQAITNIDAGTAIIADGTISGLVFEDVTADGIQSTDDLFIAGISVSLFTDMGTPIQSVMTDATGMYAFANIQAGSYYITIDTPVGAMITTADAGADDLLDSDITESVTMGSTDIITIGIGQNIANIDAGIFYPGSIAGVFFFDNNENGVIDPADMLMSSETIILQDISGTQVATAMTDAMGVYTFTGITPGEYVVSFPVSSTEEFTIANATTNDLIDSDVISISGGFGLTAGITITSNQDVLGVNGGVKDIPQFITISGVAWEDINGDGERAATDPMLEGYTATLYDAAGTMISSTMTAVDGSYSFANVPAMGYYVTFDLPTGQGFTFADASADNVDSDITESQSSGSTDIVSTNINTLDAGFYRFATIGDMVFNDFNTNGIFDNSEGGINSIRVRLFSADGTLVSTRFTNTNNATGTDGFYQFSGLRPGGYYIRVDPSGSMFFTDPNVGTDDSIDSDVNSTNGFGTTPTYTLVSGETNLTIDVGLLQDPADVGDRVWIDFNGDGIQGADEPGLNGTQVDLYGINGELIATTTTAVNPFTLNNGFYAFNNVQPGAYYMVFTPPTGYLSTIADQGGNDANDSDVTSNIIQGSTNIVNLSSGENDTDIDAGFYFPAGLGDFVFQDLDKDGIQDAGEPGIANVNVDLRMPNGSIIASTTTDADGMYTFGGLIQGVYFVSFEAPTGFMFTMADAGPDNMDSDANATGNTPLISLAHGVVFNDLDAGLYEATSLIGSRVWFDFNQDGIQTFNEGGVEDVPVSLINMSGSVIATTMTDFDGEYLFFNVPNGNYQVQFTAPENMQFTGQNIGTNDNLDSDVDASGMTSMITVNNTFDMHIDAGMYPVTGIAGSIYNDDNANNTADINEGKLSGITVELRSTANVLLDTRVTNAIGGYSFEGRAAGEYKLRFVVGEEFLSADPKMVKINDGYYETNISFNNTFIYSKYGFYKSGMIRSSVWMDLNLNDIRDEDELAISGVGVMLMTQDTSMVDYQITDDNGQVEFGRLEHGQYFVQFELEDQSFATAYRSTYDVDSDVTHEFGEGTTSLIHIMPGSESMYIDAGVLPKVMDTELLRGSFKDDHNALSWSDIDTDILILERKHISEQGFTALADDVARKSQYQDYAILKSGVYDYRLMMKDQYGYVSYSNIVRILVSDAIGYTALIMPNPIKDQGQLKVNLAVESTMTWTIHDEKGSIAKRSQQEYQLSEGEHILDLDVSNIPTGTYIMQLHFDNKRITKKLIIIE